MLCLCVTSKNYKDLVPGFQFLWDRYARMPVTILETGDVNRWCAEIDSFLSGSTEQDILLILEDYYQIAPIDVCNLKVLQQAMDGGADKVDLQGQVQFFEHTVESNGMLLAHPAARYRASTQAAIWKKSYLQKKLRSGATTPWSFELQDCDYDGAKIYGLSTPTMLYCNMIYKGTVAGYEVDRIRENDWQDMKKAGVLPDRVLAARGTQCK